MRHPIEEYNERQAAMLASLPNEQREYMARMFRFGNAVYCYYNRASDLSVFDSSQSLEEPAGDPIRWLERQPIPEMKNRSAQEILQIYWDEFLEGLPDDGLRRVLQEAGLEKAKTDFPFRRYVLERHDIGMDEFLRQNLSTEDYAFHRASGQGDGAVKE